MNQKKKILIVEDDHAIARGLKELLRSEGYAVQLAHDGKDALTRALSSFPSLVLLDVNLPHMNGLEVCRRLRSRGFRHPVIMITARSEQIDKVVGLDAGADDYVTKPFDTHEVVARVRAHLRRFETVPHSAPVSPVDSASAHLSRRLLSIMFTDMKDFSKRMDENERSALTLLKKHNDVVTREVSNHGGRIVEIIGDAFLVSFENALSAVRCGVAILRRFRNYNAQMGRTRQLHERIGIHLGDVLEVGDKVRGNTVNIAARLQQLSVPDRMYVSESVLQTVKGKIDLTAVHIGHRKMKNIKQPISIYSITV